MKREYVIVRGRVASDLHAGRADRHAGDGEAADFRPFAKEPADQIGRYVAFDDVAADERGVTGLEFRRDAMLRLQRPEIRGALHLDLETMLAQVLHPRIAAPSGGASVDRDAGASLLCGKKPDSPRHTQRQRGSARQEPDPRPLDLHAALMFGFSPPHA